MIRFVKLNIHGFLKVNAGLTTDRLARGKRSIAVNLKDPQGRAIIEKLSSKSDVLIEPFRPGKVLRQSVRITRGKQA